MLCFLVLVPLRSETETARDSLVVTTVGNVSANYYDFRDNALPAGVAVDGEATFVRLGDGSTCLKLEPGASLLVNTNVLQPNGNLTIDKPRAVATGAVKFTKREQKDYDAKLAHKRATVATTFHVSMEIQLSAMPKDALSLLQGLDNDDGTPSEGMAFLNRSGCVSAFGNSSPASADKAIAEKWFWLTIGSVGEGLQRALVVQINNTVIAKITAQALANRDAATCLNKDALWLFRSSKGTFMPGLKIRSLYVAGNYDSATTQAIVAQRKYFDLYNKELQQADERLYSKLSLHRVYRRTPPVWRHPAFVSTMATGVSIDADMASFAQVYAYALNEALTGQKHVLALLSDEKQALIAEAGDLVTNLAELSKSLPRQANAVEAAAFAKIVLSKLAALRVGHSMVVPLTHFVRVREAETSSQYLLAFERTTELTFRVVVIDVCPGTGLRYHPASAATPNEMRWKVALPIDDVPAATLMDEVFITSLMALSYAGSKCDNTPQMLYARLLPLLSPGLVFSPVLDLVPMPTEHVPTPAQLNPEHAACIAQQAADAVALAGENKVAVREIHDSVAFLGLPLPVSPSAAATAAEDESKDGAAAAAPAGAAAASSLVSTPAPFQVPADTRDPCPECEFRPVELLP